jgi:hypothetical protein
MAGFKASEYKFEPMSLEEYLKVPMAIQKEKDDLEKEYDSHLEKLEAIKALNDGSVDGQIKQIQDAIDNASQAMENPDKFTIGDLKIKMREARKVYRENFASITTAYNAQQELKKQMDAKRLQDPSYIFGTIPSMAELMQNPNISFTGASAKDFEARLAANASGITGNFQRTHYEAKDKTGHYPYVTKYGFNLDEIYSYMDYANLIFNEINGQIDDVASANLMKDVIQKYGKDVWDNFYWLAEDLTKEYKSILSQAGVDANSQDGQKVFSDMVNAQVSQLQGKTETNLVSNANTNNGHQSVRLANAFTIDGDGNIEQLSKDSYGRLLNSKGEEVLVEDVYTRDQARKVQEELKNGLVSRWFKDVETKDLAYNKAQKDSKGNIYGHQALYDIYPRATYSIHFTNEAKDNAAARFRIINMPSDINMLPSYQVVKEKSSMNAQDYFVVACAQLKRDFEKYHPKEDFQYFADHVGSFVDVYEALDDKGKHLGYAICKKIVL